MPRDHGHLRRDDLLAHGNERDPSQIPCSIAGKLCLLRGSEMCSRKFTPDGAEYMSDRELKEVFGASRFRLGWWESEDGAGRRFGIDVYKKEEMEEHEMREGWCDRVKIWLQSSSRGRSS